MPSITVLIPAYNAARFVEETLTSVAMQTRKPDEIVVVDDGSTDGSYEKVHSFRKCCSIPIKVIRTKNGGAAAARNTGFRSIRTDLVACLDGDDLYLPDHLELLESAFIAFPDLVLAFGDLRCLAVEGAADQANFFEAARIQRVPYENLPGGFRRIRGSAFPTLLEGDYIGTPSALFRTESAAGIGFMDESFPVRNDLDFFLRLSRVGAFAYTPRTVGVFRRHQTNISDQRRLFFQALWYFRCLAKMSRTQEQLKLTSAEKEVLNRVLHARAFDLAYASSRRGPLAYVQAAREVVSVGLWSPFLRPRHVLRTIAFGLQPDGEATL